MDRGYEIIAGLGAFIGFGGLVTISGWIWRLSGRLAKLESDAEAAEKAGAEARGLAVSALAELANFKLDAAKTYVQAAALERLEGRLEAGFSAMREELRDQQRTIVEALAARRTPARARE